MEVERRVIPRIEDDGVAGAPAEKLTVTGISTSTTSDVTIAMSPRRNENSQKWKIGIVSLALVVVLGLVVSAGVKASRIQPNHSDSERISADYSQDVVFSVLASREQFGQISNVFEYEVSKQCGLPSYLVSLDKVEDGERSGGLIFVYVTLSGPSEELLTASARRLFEQWRRGVFARFNVQAFYESSTLVPIADADEEDGSGEVSPTAPVRPDGSFSRRIACGSDVDVFDRQRNVFQADDFYRGGIALRKVSATRERLYQTQRYFVQSLLGEGYKIPVADGIYLVKLHFVELQFAESNTRVFNVLLEDTPIRQTSIDVFAETAAVGSPLVVQTIVSVDDGTLDITFEKIAQNPSIAAIEIFSAH